MEHNMEYKFEHLQHVRVIDDSSPLFGEVGEVGVRFYTTNPELKWELNVPMYFLSFEKKPSEVFYEWQLREIENDEAPKNENK